MKLEEFQIQFVNLKVADIELNLGKELTASLKITQH